MLGLAIESQGAGAAEVLVELGNGGLFSGQSFKLGGGGAGAGAGAGTISAQNEKVCLDSGNGGSSSIRLVSCNAQQALGWVAFKL
jgi:hypothetical protein